MTIYHDGSRRLQDRLDSRRLADRVEELEVHSDLSVEDRETLAHAMMFFLATADTEGRPECSYKGGDPGFVRVLDDRTLAFPSYDGNGMFKSLGNVMVNPHVGMLFIDFERGTRLRINGTAVLEDAGPLLELYPGAALAVRVRVSQVFPNCPRYVHRMKLVSPSNSVPRPGHVPPVPEWKQRASYRDVLPREEAASPPVRPRRRGRVRRGARK